MNNSPEKSEKLPKEEYNKISVHYCKECLSLAIMRVAGMENACYCDKCGCTDTAEASIEEWEALYKQKHGFAYLDSTY